MNTDRIEKRLELKAPASKVWRALTNHQEFGQWFGMRLEGPFVAGRTVKGKITDHECKRDVEMEVRKIEPETYFSYAWHPYAMDPAVDYSKETPTLVEFRLEPIPAGTLLTVTESGFDQIPAARRDEAFRKHTGGWEEQMHRIKKYVAQA